MEFDRINAGATEEDVEILRDRIIECLCDEVLTNKLTKFHGVDMVKLCAKAFLDKVV